MALEIPASLKSNLRNCQISSIDKVDEYIRSRSKGSCLISLPTGAGKTGVISVVANLITKKNILVITHRRAVCDQLYKNLKGCFFEKIQEGLSETLVTKNVFNGLGDEHSEGIFCTTFQTLDRVDEIFLRKLREKTDVIIIDEGHAEPSNKWSLLVRSFKKSKKIIITATPYRNDLFIFDIDVNHNFIYTFKAGVEDEIIYRPNFESINIENLIAKLSEIFEDYPDAKCIVKCKDFQSIRNYFTYFKNNFSTMAVHEQFKDFNEEHCFVDVPKNISETEYKILIHQKKLDEGIDLPAAKVSVLTYPVGSGRELVQTIGRVVRVFNDYPALVLDTTNQEANAQLWNTYLKFDEYLSNPSSAKKFLKTLDTAKLIENYIDNFPEYSYFETGFRQKFDFKSFEPFRSLEIPLASVCFYKKDGAFSLPNVMEILNWENEREGALSNFKITNDNEGVTYYITFNNSKFLRDSLFFQPSLEITIIKELDGILAIFDSRGRTFSDREDLGIKRTIDANTLFKMASHSDKTITRQANTIALDKSEKRAEGILLKGSNLEEINHPQNNSSYAVSTMIVSNIESNKELSKYYLGVASGRISDQKKYRFSYAEFIQWLEDVNEILKQKNDIKSPFLNSYAQTSIQLPSDSPLACMIDLTDIEGDIEIKYLGKVKTFDNTFFYFTYNQGINIFEPDYFFDCKRFPFNSAYSLNKKINSTNLTYHSSTEKITFIIGDDNTLIANSNPNYTFYLNNVEIPITELFHSANVKLIFDDGITYYNKEFYKILLPTQTGVLNTNIIKNIIPLECLLKPNLTEKDDKHLTSDCFGKDSIFYEIDKMSNIHKGRNNISVEELGEFYDFLPDLDLMLLTDLDKEPADFIVSSPRKIVYIHVKCGTASKRPESPAGAICEVGGQALKNIHHVVSRTPIPFANKTALGNPWRTKDVPSGITLNTRIRLFNKAFDVNANLSDVIELIEKRSVNPIVEKEIWVVVGNSFSRKNFITSLNNRSNIKGKTLQAYQLLDTWFAQASNHNVNLKFFVSE